MRVTSVLFLALFLGLVPAALARDAGAVTVQGILVRALDQPGQTDPRIAPYEPNLKRVLRFESYQSVGDGRLSMGVPDVQTMAIGRGHTLVIETLSADGNQVRLRVKWMAGKNELLNTTLRLLIGTPAVLGGPRGQEGGVLGVIVLVL